MSNNTPKASRRGFFAGAATVGAAAAAVATLPKLSPTQETDQPKAAPTKGGGYSLSEHVKRYYQTTRV
jgi:hypothetical protein